MEFKQSTIEEIIESEREMVMRGAELYGDYFVNAMGFNDLLQGFIKSVDPDRFIFAMFLSQIRVHHTLALLSSARRHHVQSMMDLRQVLEAGTWAAYAIVNINKDDFSIVDEYNIADVPAGLIKKRNKWLDDNFKKGSDFIKNMKDSINSSAAHSNIVYAYNNFRFDGENGVFVTPFFDVENDYLIKADLWQIANIALGIMDLLYGANKDLNVVKFLDDFIPNLKALEAENIRLKKEMMSSERFKKSQEIESLRSKKVK